MFTAPNKFKSWSSSNAEAEFATREAVSRATASGRIFGSLDLENATKVDAFRPNRHINAPYDEEVPDQPEEAISLQSKVPGVVTQLTEQSVVLSVTLPRGHAEVELHRSYLEERLAKYGQPIFLSWERINGRKSPVIRKRDFICALPIDNDIEALNNEIQSL